MQMMKGVVSNWSMSVSLVRRVLLSVQGGRYSEQMASLKEGRYMHVAQASVCVGSVMVCVGIPLKAWMDVPPPPSSRSVLVTGGQRASVSGCVGGTFVSCMQRISGVWLSSAVWIYGMFDLKLRIFHCRSVRVIANVLER